MSAIKALFAPEQRRNTLSALLATITTTRFSIYVLSALASLSISYLLGKDMTWDTLDYHLYAGFSALHDRFVRDYFAAGTQSYFNPYAYVPFYLLATAGISALTAASVLAAVQAAILWLSYELALALVPDAQPRIRIAIGICVVLLTLANPILINQFGTSSADVTTGEIVLAGWLCLVRALGTPSHKAIVTAGLLLGIVSALKLTNSVHALSAGMMLLFMPVPWRDRLRYSASFGLALGIGFVMVALPWAIHLERHFGNPVFPLLNSIFRSPQFSTRGVQDLRFVPSAFTTALWRPFETAAPLSMVDDEFAAPDLRYAVLAVVFLVALVRWSWRRYFRSDTAEKTTLTNSSRVVMALGSAFLVDWTLWLDVSGNARYFTAMASVAAALTIVLIFRLFGSKVRMRNYVLVVFFAAQTIEVCAGATYRDHVAWDGGPWFEVSAPTMLVAKPALYFDFEEQSNSFVIPFLARGSGFINVDGDYVIPSDGANGRDVRRLISKYWPHLRVSTLQTSSRRNPLLPPDLSHENDTLAHFGLRVETADCTGIHVRDIQAPWRTSLRDQRSGGALVRVAQSTNATLVTCRVVSRVKDDSPLFAHEARANLVFRRLESACPKLFRPDGTVTLDFGDEVHGYAWMRRYGATGLSIVINGGIVKFIDPLRGGPAVYLGTESEWQKAPVNLSCWRRNQRYYAALR